MNPNLPWLRGKVVAFHGGEWMTENNICEYWIYTYKKNEEKRLPNWKIIESDVENITCVVRQKMMKLLTEQIEKNAHDKKTMNEWMNGWNKKTTLCGSCYSTQRVHINAQIDWLLDAAGVRYPNKYTMCSTVVRISHSRTRDEQIGFPQTFVIECIFHPRKFTWTIVCMCVFVCATTAQSNEIAKNNRGRVHSSKKMQLSTQQTPEHYLLLVRAF